MEFNDFYLWKDHSSLTTLNRNTKFRFKNIMAITARRGSFNLFYKSHHDEPEFKVLDFFTSEVH
jgi:hypothetical protein